MNQFSYESEYEAELRQELNQAQDNLFYTRKRLRSEIDVLQRQISFLSNYVMELEKQLEPGLVAQIQQSLLEKPMNADKAKRLAERLGVSLDTAMKVKNAYTVQPVRNYDGPSSQLVWGLYIDEELYSVFDTRAEAWDRADEILDQQLKDLDEANRQEASWQTQETGSATNENSIQRSNHQN